jgi:MYXO-CTERM domain-containing protein
MKAFWKRFENVALIGAMFLSVSGCSFADSFVASYLPVGVQTPAGITTNYETFDSQSAGTNLTAPFVTTFNGSGITGTYTGGIVWTAANQYGGAGGTGVYPEVLNGSSYTLSLSASVNYFGLWFSALDPGNQLQFFNGSTLLYTFTPAQFISLVGVCPGSQYCGNPNSAFLGDDSGEQFAYLNFFDSNGTFNKVVFSEIGNPGGGFESDNQAVALLNGQPPGTPIITPEPASFGLLAVAGLSLLPLLRRRR